MRGALVTSALLSSVMFGATTAATAEVVRFDNPPPGEPGHFEWAVPRGSEPNLLDITLDAVSQPSATGETALFHDYDPEAGLWGSVGNTDNLGWAKVSKQMGTYFLNALVAGELVSEAISFDDYGYTSYAGYAGEIDLADGVPGYLGVTFDTGGGYQYGWIGVVRTGNVLNAFAWGYETEPGVPIAAGAQPGTPCPGDLTGDDTVNFDDLLDLFGMWGPCAAPCPGDLAGPGGGAADGVVNFDDLLALFAEWGECA